MNDPRIAALRELEAGVEALLSSFERRAEPTAAQMESVWAHCASAFGRFRELQEAREGEPLPPEVRRRMEHVQKLHAVAASLVVRHGEELAQELRTVRDVRSRLDHCATRPAGGETCDLRG